MYRPSETQQMTTPMQLQQPVSERINGVLTKTYSTVNGVIMANFKTYGGTERESNNVYVVEDTAQIVCWYRPDIKSNCRLIRLTDNAVFEVIGEPENIEMRNMFLSIKLRRVKGGA